MEDFSDVDHVLHDFCLTDISGECRQAREYRYRV
jgi:hypothetical protein